MRSEATEVKATLTEIEDWLDRLLQLSEEVSASQYWCLLQQYWLVQFTCLTQMGGKFTADQAISTPCRIVILDAVKVNMFPSVIAIYLKKTHLLAVLTGNVCWVMITL